MEKIDKFYLVSRLLEAYARWAYSNGFEFDIDDYEQSIRYFETRSEEDLVEALDWLRAHTHETLF